MKAVMLFSHGSLLCGSGVALEEHAARLRSRGVADLVEVGYLNYSEPPFADAVARCVAAGADRIIVAPYFLVPGYFVRVDLPRCMDAARAAHPHVEMVVAEPIGFDPRLADAMIALAIGARGPESWREDLSTAALYCRPDPVCPLFETAACPKRPGDRSLGAAVASTAEVGPAGIHIALAARATGGDCIVGRPNGLEAAEPGGPELSPAGASGAGGAFNPPHPAAGVELAGRSRDAEAGTASSALLVMVHGSPRPEANADVFRVSELIRARSGFPLVETAFMECNEPTIPETIDRFVEAGALEVRAVPYFLHTGKHVADDLPCLLDAARLRHPSTRFKLGRFLGSSPQLTDILADRIAVVA